VAVDAARLFDREKILRGDRLQGRRRDGHRLGHTRNAQRPCEALHVGHVLGDGRVGGRLADGVRDVDGEEIAAGEELVDGGQADMIGVDEIGVPPLHDLTAASASARTSSGRVPIRECSRFDLFHTGVIATPRCLAA